MAGIENAREIRDRILAHLRAHGGGTGLGDLDDHADHHAPAAAGGGSSLLDAIRDVRDAAHALRSDG